MNLSIPLILVLIALLHVIMGSFLIYKNKSALLNITFATVLYGAALWSFSMAMFMLSTNMEIATAWARIYYFATAIILFSFIFFSDYYPYPSGKLTNIRTVYLFLSFLFVVFIIFHPTLLIHSAVKYDWGNDARENIIGHILFTIYFFLSLLISYKILFFKFRKSDGIIKQNLKLVIWATLISFIFGIIFDIVLNFAGTYKYIWFGPIGTAITLLALIYIIFYKK